VTLLFTLAMDFVMTKTMLLAALGMVEIAAARAQARISVQIACVVTALMEVHA
jgi:hypothetical protein